MSESNNGAHVIVVGAGPVGMTAALILARQGVPVTVLEAGEALSSESRASTFHPPTLEMLEEFGLVDELRALGIDVPTFQYRDRRGGLIAEFDLSVLEHDTKFPFRVQCEQSQLTQIILDKLKAYDHAVVKFNSGVTGVEQNSTGVVATLEDGRTLDGTYLIGADGAGSAVRKAIGSRFEGITYPERYLVISTQEDIKAFMPDISYVNYISDPEEWLVLIRTPEHWRMMFPVRPGTTDEQALESANVQRLMTTIGEKDGPWPVLHTTLYKVHQRVAASYRVGRVFLAGDAAHINNPLGGLGMNSGIHDAYLLAPLLTKRLAGEIDDAALDEYQARRQTVSEEYVAVETDKNWKRIRETDETQRKLQHAELREIAADPVRHLDYVRRTCMLSDLANAR